MKTIKKIIGIFIIGIMVSGCMVPKASIEVDQKAKNLVAPTGKALVYIVRPSSLGGAVKFKVSCDYKFIGATSGKRYIYTIQEPGNHEFISKAENEDILPIVLEANKTYYIEQVPKMGFLVARNRLALLDELSGKQKLMDCKLSADNVEK